jgi:hypothetical protein
LVDGDVVADFYRNRNEIGRLEVRFGVDEPFQRGERKRRGSENDRNSARCPAAPMTPRALAVKRAVNATGDSPGAL